MTHISAIEVRCTTASTGPIFYNLSIQTIESLVYYEDSDWVSIPVEASGWRKASTPAAFSTRVLTSDIHIGHRLVNRIFNIYFSANRTLFKNSLRTTSYYSTIYSIGLHCQTIERCISLDLVLDEDDACSLGKATCGQGGRKQVLFSDVHVHVFHGLPQTVLGLLLSEWHKIKS